MMKILDFDGLAPEEFLNRDIRAEEDVSAAVDGILADVRSRIEGSPGDGGGIRRRQGGRGPLFSGDIAGGGGEYPPVP